jgi:Arc/MetJ-type ribon-helix-helix transcriptional regulator
VVAAGAGRGLPGNQQIWLEEQVAAGRFGSVDDAVAIAVADLMGIENDDLSWSKPYADEARAAVARGETVSLEDAMRTSPHRSADGAGRRYGTS